MSDQDPSDIQILNAILAMPDEKFLPPWNTRKKYLSMRYQITQGRRRELSDVQRADAEAFFEANGLTTASPPVPPSSSRARRKGRGTPPATSQAPTALPPHPLDVHLRNLPKKPAGRT